MIFCSTKFIKNLQTLFSRRSRSRFPVEKVTSKCKAGLADPFVQFYVLDVHASFNDIIPRCFVLFVYRLYCSSVCVAWLICVALILNTRMRTIVPGLLF